MDSDLSPQDKKDLDKFIKFFALKTVQVIVQARLGEKICTRSSSSPTGSDWFNLAIKDIPEVTHEAKKALAGQLPGIGRSMCVEISLKTSEGDSMELETWCLEMNEKCDKDIKVSYTVYNRLSLLLKSLLAITRVTPAYKLSRKQGHDYVILYRQFERTAPIMGIIIDHFVDRNPNKYLYQPISDVCMPSFFIYIPSLILMGIPGKEGGVPQQVPVQPCHAAQAEHARASSCLPNDHVPAVPSGSGEDAEASSRSTDGKSVSPRDVMETTFTRKVGAFVNKPGTQVTTASLDLPFAAFAPRAYDIEENDPMVQPPESPATSSPLQGSLHSQGSGESGVPAQDDFVMVDFKPAFSKDDLLPMDLGTFYREFQNPPQLASLTIDVSSQSMAEDLDSLPEKLAVYEKNIDEFDAFVDTLQ
uniref:Autophagy-related protein 13 n=1 Tax=Esox lucius TaxID=8010 RepID=A0AAY5KA70_ESOLU